MSWLSVYQPTPALILTHGDVKQHRRRAGDAYEGSYVNHAAGNPAEREVVTRDKRRGAEDEPRVTQPNTESDA